MYLFNEKHPASFIVQYCIDNADYIKLGIYEYKPQTIEDKRYIYRYNPGALYSDEVFFTLYPKQELAFHSTIWNYDGSFHLPQVDCYGDLTAADWERIKEVLDYFECADVKLFNSGRSYHVYGLVLLDYAAWQRYMGRLLLLNTPDRTIIDPRWVGHSLIRGDSALRWTNQSGNYLHEPYEVNPSDLK